MRNAWLALAVLVVGCTDPRGTDAPFGEVRLCWGGPGRSPGRFHKPRAIAAGRGNGVRPPGRKGSDPVSADRLYVVDMSGRIQVFDLDGTWRTTWRLRDVSRGYPAGLAVRADGGLVVADTHNYVVRTYSPTGEEVSVLGGEGAGPGEFTYLTDVAFDGEGNMFVSERGREDRIQKFGPDGRFIRMWGRSGSGPGEFRRAQGLAVDALGSVYVADAANHRIQKFSNDGDIEAVWGDIGREPGQLMYPYGLALTPGGYLLVCEYGNNRIQAFDAAGRSCGIWGRAGRGPGELCSPWGVAFVSGRGIYVADTGNHRVQVFAAPDWLSTPTADPRVSGKPHTPKPAVGTAAGGGHATTAGTAAEGDGTSAIVRNR